VPFIEEDRCYIIEDLFICDEYDCTGAVNHWVIPETVGQYTGMTDKNGKKIFEGDIIKTITNSFDRDEFVSEIKFGARSGVQGFHLANGRMMFYFGQKDLTVMDDTEVIGNIHDNPELLKGGEG
jgi:uncharacterized phage protein (TIGR01671 family)